MGAEFIFVNTTTLAFINVETLYSEGRIESLIAERITKKRDELELDNSICLRIITDLHKMMLENGDSDQNRNRHGSNPYGWYMASCEVSIIQLQQESEVNYSLEICHIGQVCVYLHRQQTGEVVRISPMHNVSEELQQGTIEESNLAPFFSRSNEEIARQLLTHSPELIPNLSHLERHKFYESIAHVRTRAVGYVQDPNSPKPGSYRKDWPVPDSGVFHSVLPGDTLLIYLPRTNDLIPYQSQQLMETVIELEQKPGVTIPFQSLGEDSINVRKGQLVCVEIMKNGVFGLPLIRGT